MIKKQKESKSVIVIMSIFRLVDMMMSYRYTHEQPAWLKAKLTLQLAPWWGTQFPKGKRLQKCGRGLVTKDQMWNKPQLYVRCARRRL